jgi:hypothetical protein
MPRGSTPSRSGGIGRRAGFKIRFPLGSVGSSPTFGISGPAIRINVLLMGRRNYSPKARRTARGIGWGMFLAGGLLILIGGLYLVL